MGNQLPSTPPPSRRDLIGQAAVEIVGTEGLRALTHRAVDARAGIPAGSTSYYARTRADLINLVVDRLAAGTLAEVDVRSPMPGEGLPAEGEGRIEVVAAALTDLLATLEGRDVEARARYVLLGELQVEESSWQILAAPQRVAEGALAAAERAWGLLEVEDPAGRAQELLMLLDGLLFQRVIARRTVPVGPIILAYLRGVVRP